MSRERNEVPDTPKGHVGRHILASINLFIPYYVATAFSTIWLFMEISDAFFRAIGFTGKIGFAQIVRLSTPFVLVAGVLLIFWKVIGLVPMRRKPFSDDRYFIGHAIVGVTSFLVAISIGLMIAISYTHSGYGEALGWYLLPVFFVAVIGWGIGVVLIWSTASTAR